MILIFGNVFVIFLLGYCQRSFSDALNFLKSSRQISEYHNNIESLLLFIDIGVLFFENENIAHRIR